MRAIVFSAGLGTRLKPLTNTIPKAMVQLNGKPLLWHAIEKLKAAGIREIIVNVHHFSEQLIAYIENTNFEIPVSISDESDQLLDTGGGILKAKEFLKQSRHFMAFNVDIVSTVNLSQLIEFHKNNKAMATLVVRERSTSRYLFWDKNHQLTGWKNLQTNEEKIVGPTFHNSTPYAFSGIQLLSSEIFDQIEEDGKFSIIDLYLRLGKTASIKCFIDRSDFWIDLGKPGQLEEAERILTLPSK